MPEDREATETEKQAMLSCMRALHICWRGVAVSVDNEADKMNLILADLVAFHVAAIMEVADLTYDEAVETVLKPVRVTLEDRGILNKSN